MWPQYNQYLPFVDPRMYPQLYAPVNQLFYENKIKSKGSEYNSSKSVICVDIDERPSLSQILADDVEFEDGPQKSEDIKINEDITVEDIEADCAYGYNELRRDRYSLRHQELLGLRVTSGSVALRKDEKNLIGISIGGGAPLCPCLYIVQIFESTPAARDGTLESGDELVGVNGQTVKGKTKVEVAKMIQSAKEEVTINYNKLHAEPKQGKSLDIVLKKVKHRFVEKMSSGAADALGLSRAILCNDALLGKLAELRRTELMYRDLVDHAKRMLKAHLEVSASYRAMGEVFAAVGVREPQPRASEAFTRLADLHRQCDRDVIQMLKATKPILGDMGTYLNKAIPDTKLTIRKYADAKFEYLSYCLKVKEMDDEEVAYSALREPLYRVETGNYEYRLVLRCRGMARAVFAQRRLDVLAKLELLQDKHHRDLALHLRRLLVRLAHNHSQTIEHLKENATLFPVEVDLSQNAFQYKSTAQFIQENQEEDEIEYGREIEENYDISESISKGTKINRIESKDKNIVEDASEQLLSGLDVFGDAEPDTHNLTLLKELGLADLNTTDDFGEFQNGSAIDDILTHNKESDDVFDKLLNELSVDK